MHELDIKFIKELITTKLKEGVIRKSMFLRLVSNGNLNYQAKDYELVVNQMIRDGELIEKDEFIRSKDAQDLTKLFTEHNGVSGILGSKI